jgi:hypothetical protein
MEIELDGRNTVWGIGERTIKNLNFLVSAHTMQADVHVVTALINDWPPARLALQRADRTRSRRGPIHVNEQWSKWATG